MIDYVPSAVKLREYERIFTGSNQEEGYENPFLEFRADTVLQILATDETTFFHYPETSPILALSASTLVVAGAVASRIPYESDRIWKKEANYKKYIWWGNSTIPTPGVWLCAWLSGNASDFTAPPIWKDRWFNPGYIDPNTALFVTSPSAVYDVDSELTLEPGVWYKYFHIGNLYNQMFTNNLSGTVSALRLNVDDWGPPAIDASPYKNSIVLNGYTVGMVSIDGVNPEHAWDTCLNLNGTNQEASVLYNDNFVLKDTMSCSFWARSKNWSNIDSCYTLIGNNFRGGWGVKFNNGFYTPTYTMFSRTGKLLFGNAGGQAYFTKTLPGTSLPQELAIDNNLFTWVIDNGDYEGYKHLYKIDCNGDIKEKADFDQTVNLASLTLDASGNVWVLDTNSSRISEFNPFDCIIMNSFTVPNWTRFIDFDLTNTLRTSAMRTVYDNNTVGWSITAGSVAKEGVVFSMLSAIDAQSLTCDKLNNIWVSCLNNTYIKLQNTGAVTTSGIVGSAAVSAQHISFTNEYNAANGEYTDYLWITNESEKLIYKCDLFGNVIRTINLTPWNLGPAAVDFTSYQWNRKFNYLSPEVQTQPQLQVEMFLGTETEPSSGRYTVSYPATAVSNNDWHLFTFTYNSSSGEFIFYIDTILRAAKTLPIGAKIYYNYENPLFIGADPGKIVHLGEEISYSGLHFKGMIDDVRIYSCILNNYNLWHIYASKYDYQDIKWNMPTGEQSYLEEIERFFKFKLPGQKSQYYNIKLTGLQITDPEVRELIESIIKDTVKKIAPAYTELYKIIWN